MNPADSDFTTPSRRRGRRQGQSRVSRSGSRGAQSLGSDAFQTPARTQTQRGSYEFQTPSQTRRNSTNRKQRPQIQRGELGTPSSSQPFFLKDGQGNPYAAGITDDTYVFGAKVKVKEVLSRFTDFVRNFYEDETAITDSPKYVDLLRETATNGTFHYCVDMQHVHGFDAKLYNYIVSYPKQFIPLFDEELLDICISELQISDPSPVHFRPFNLSKTKPIRDLDPTDLHRIVAASGMVTRVSSIIPEMKLATFQCHKCGKKVQVPCEQNTVAEPLICSQCSEKHSNKLKHELSVFASKQVIKMQESPEAIPEGETPHTVTLNTYDEMVDTCRPGDRIKITGLYTPTPSRVHPNQRTLHAVYRTFLEVLHVEVIDTTRLFSVNQKASQAQPDSMQEVYEMRDANIAQATQSLGGLVLEERIAKEVEMKSLGDDPLIYEKLVSSLAPSIWEMEDVKKGVLCQLFGGTSKDGVSEGGVRSDINILLVGDPGVSKSQLLTYVDKVSPRGFYTSGRGNSAVGLTAFVAKDPDTREMVLESGALVLSDTGICCIDEFDKVSENARSMLLEVMEQQTVSVAKAGIVSTLNARTSILASANPVGSKYNPDLTVVQNIQLPPALVSRFDLIYLLLDVPDESRDQRLARHLVALSQPSNVVHTEGIIPTQKLREYISYARDRCKPIITQETGKVLLKEYIDMRRVGVSQKTITATPRQLESFIRLSEALAKMQLKDYVEVEHVNEAVQLVKSALRSSFIDKNGRMDLDTMYTGVSQHEKRMRQLLASELKRILQGQSLTFHELLQTMHQQSQEKVTQQSLRDALSMLKNEVTIGAGGRMHMVQQD